MMPTDKVSGFIYRLIWQLVSEWQVVYNSDDLAWEWGREWFFRYHGVEYTVMYIRAVDGTDDYSVYAGRGKRCVGFLEGFWLLSRLLCRLGYCCVGVALCWFAYKYGLLDD